MFNLSGNMQVSWGLAVGYCFRLSCRKLFFTVHAGCGEWQKVFVGLKDLKV